jgi:hypothetical protein
LTAYTSAMASTGDIQSALAGLAELRTRLPNINGVALAREARTELEQRTDVLTCVVGIVDEPQLLDTRAGAAIRSARQGRAWCA